MASHIFVTGFMGSGKSTIGKKVTAHIKINRDKIEAETVAQLLIEKIKTYRKEDYGTV
jgi:shikimate kinase